MLRLNWTAYLPLTLTVLDFAAAVGYLIDRDWRHVIYWTAAGILTLSVTL